MERAKGLEPSTFSLATRRSTTELCPLLILNIKLVAFEKLSKWQNDCIKKDKLMGMVQSKKNGNEVYKIGCLGKISDFHRGEDNRVLISYCLQL